MATPRPTNLKVVKSDCDTTPAGAVFLGEYIQWGPYQKKVFHENIDIRETEEVKDAQGNPIWKRGPGGITLDSTLKITRTVGKKEREFIVDDLGNGQAIKVYQFRPDAEEVKRQERAERKKKFVDELFEKAEAAGGLDALLDTDDEPDPEPETPKRRGRKAA